MSDVELTRRRLLELGLALPVPFVLAACVKAAFCSAVIVFTRERPGGARR